MRSLSSLATRRALSQDERAFAQNTYEHHLELLTENDPATVVLEVDPCAPALLERRFSGFPLQHILDATTALQIARGIDSIQGIPPANINVPDGIPPHYLQEHSRTPFDAEAFILTTQTGPSWMYGID